MSRIQSVRENWTEITERLRSDKQVLANFLRFSAGMYKQGFPDAALIYQQNPNATKVATLEAWNKLGRLVNKGERSIAVFGEDKYYLVTVNIFDGGIDNQYYVDVYGRKVEGVDELYVKNEAYYGKVIKERMEEWLDGYVSETNIREYYILYNSTITNQFSSEYDTDASAEEIIKSVSSIEDNIERSDLTLYVIISQSEYKKHFDIENEFLELKTHINEINGKVNVSVTVYNDEDYLRKKNDEKSDFEQLEKIKIID